MRTVNDLDSKDLTSNHENNVEQNARCEKLEFLMYRKFQFTKLIILT